MSDNGGAVLTGSKMDTKEARAAIEQERRERIEACSRDIAEVLQSHRCRLDVSVLLREGQILPQIGVVPED